MAIQFELYKTPRAKDEEGKEMYHARVVNFQHIDTDYLAKEIQIATSLTEGDGKSVLESLSHFMGDRLREGQSVHLDGIGYFQIKLNSQEPITSPKLKANQIKLKANISFKADVKLKKSVSVVHVERSKLKPHSAVLSNDEIDKLLTNYFKSNPVLTRRDFQGLCGFAPTTAARQIKRLKEEEKKYPSKTEIKNLRVLKIIFPIAVTTVVALFVPSAVPLIGMLMFGNLVKEIGSNTFRLFDAASNSIMNAATIFLGLSVGATMTAEAFLNWTTIGIVVGGFLAFALSITGGICLVKLFNLFSKKKINPLIGATGLSAVPMASRVANEIALKYDSKNHVLQYCMASNISGVIGSAVAAGVLISFLA